LPNCRPLRCAYRAGGQSTASGTNRPGQQRCSCRLTVERSTNLPIVWCCISPLGSRERGGRTHLQNGDSQHNLPTTFLLHVYASHSMFQPITRDLGKCREIPNFALSRRQHGFEPRWGHKIKMPLTSPDNITSQHLLGSTARDARGTQELPPVLPSARCGSADFACPMHGARAPMELCCVAGSDLVWDRTARWHPATTRLDDHASLPAEGLSRHLGDHQACAIRLKDAGR
jgi:hypothetical protein